MAGTDVAVRQQPETLPAILSNDQLQYIAGTEFVPPGLRGNLPAILACVATGRALGIPDMTALRSIHIIDGKATFSAELMVQLVRRRGHSITGTVGPSEAVVTGRRADNGDEMTVTWTLEMAERAGLVRKGNWQRYPEAMLWARAASQLCRMLFADCFAGATYTPEEIGAETDADGVPVAPAAEVDVLEGTPLSDGWEDHAPEYTPAAPVKLASDAQKKKLNVLVGKLRQDGVEGARVTTPRLYATVAMLRGTDTAALERHLPAARDVDGVLHWGPLRDDLRKDEASYLIEKLGEYEAEAA